MLSERLSVGRTPVREALQRLAREGLVTILPRRGVVVSDLDLGAQMRLLEVRRELDRLIARSAAARATDAHRTALDAIAAAMETAADEADGIAFMRLDRAFNQLLLEASGNEFSAAAMGLINGLSRRHWFAHFRAAADLPHAARLHAAVARAVARADAAAAAEESDALVGYIQAFTRRSIG